MADAASVRPLASAPPPIMSNGAIARLLRGRVETSRRAPGGAIGLLDDRRVPRVITHGRLAFDGGAPVAADTLFELGCVTKVLTALLCADMAVRGEIALTDPIADYLPFSIATIGRNGAATTIEHLVTHTSGLPNHSVGVLAALDEIYAYADEHLPRHDVGAHYRYSTIGFTLLGEVLARRAGLSHAALVHERICAPLGMTDTVVDPPPAARARLAMGHNAALTPLGPMPVIPVTGGRGFHSTIRDLLALLSAFDPRVDTPLAEAAAMTRIVRHPGAPGLEQVAMGWHVGTLDGVITFSHDGHSLGHRAFVGYTLSPWRAVAALLNGIAPIGVTDICRHLLNPACAILPDDSTLLRPAQSMTLGAAVDRTLLERFVGVYQLTPEFRVAVGRDGDRLYLEKDGERQTLSPRDAASFWLPAAGLRTDSLVRFEEDGVRPAAMIVTDRGWDRRLVRIETADDPSWHGRRPHAGPPADPRVYTGSYVFGELALDVRVADGVMSAGWRWAGVGQSSAMNVFGTAGTGGTSEPHELIYEGDHRFFFKTDEVDALLRFEVGADGRAIAVTCEANGRAERGARLPAIAC